MTGSPTGVYDGRNAANHVCQVTEKLIDDLTVKQLAIFELGNKFSKELQEQKQGKFKPTTEVEEDKRTRTIERVSDVQKITPSQHGLPEEVFAAKQDKKMLVKTEHLKQEENKKILYILQDNSGSMGGQVGFSSGGRSSCHGLYTRGSLSQLFSFGIARRVRDDKGTLFHRFFAGAPSELREARGKANDFEAMLEWIRSASFDEGSTDIDAAVKAAVADIKRGGGSLELSEILLITDCEAELDASKFPALLQGCELNVLDVAGNGSKEHAVLKAVATKYYKVNESAANVSKLVELI
jgi:uncharacterized protein with von Willebrand factor type A (vWA) domain